MTAPIPLSPEELWLASIAEKAAEEIEDAAFLQRRRRETEERDGWVFCAGMERSPFSRIRSLYDSACFVGPGSKA